MARRILRTIRLDKIAAVDRPCQEHARVAILKRAPDIENKDYLAERITKDLMMAPMSLSDSKDAVDFNSVLEDTLECNAWYATKEELRPYVESLKDSLFSIFRDAKLDSFMRAFMIRSTVSQFLDSVQQKFDGAIPGIEQSVAEKRLRDIQKRVLLAKSGVALLSTLLITKEFDESKHPRDTDGRFGSGGGSGAGEKGSSSEDKTGAKSPGHSEILRVLQFGAGLGALYNVAQAATVISGFAGLGAGAMAAGTGAGVLIGSMALSAAAPFVIGAVGWEITRRILRGMNKAEKPAEMNIKQIKQKIVQLSPKEAKEFNAKFMNELSSEQADKVAVKMKEILTQAKSKLESKYGVKKIWSSAAWEASAEARRRARGHRVEAVKHKSEGRSISALKHEVVADHYEEAADHYAAGRTQRGHDVRRNGEAILGIHKSAELKKAIAASIVGRKRTPRSFPPNGGPRRGKQGPRESRQMVVGTEFGLQKIAEVIVKSSIVLAALPDPVEHVRKVIGNTAGDYIDDFVHSTNPKFEGKSKQERIRMALGAYYSNNK